MNRRKLLSLLLALVFLFCTGKVLYQLYQYYQGDQVYAQAEELAGLPETRQPAEAPEAPGLPPVVQTLLDMDLDALETVNSDVLGWITIPDSPISYPMVQGADNQYYLTRTWDKQHNSAGAIFLDWHVQADFSDFNTIIYGHRMRNNSMFGSLKSYRDAEYWRTHPDLYITTPEGVSRYRIFAAYEVSVLGTAYQMAFEDEDSRRDFLALCAEQSVIDTGTVPAPEDPVVTLSTCTGGSYANRWVVQATLAETFPAE